MLIRGLAVKAVDSYWNQSSSIPIRYMRSSSRSASQKEKTTDLSVCYYWPEEACTPEEAVAVAVRRRCPGDCVSMTVEWCVPACRWSACRRSVLFVDRQLRRSWTSPRQAPAHGSTPDPASRSTHCVHADMRLIQFKIKSRSLLHNTKFVFVSYVT